jgi:hypothetical protein
MDQNKIPHDPHLLGVPSGASKTIFEPMVHLVQTLHLTSWLTLSPNGMKRASPWTSYIEVPTGASKTISKPMVYLAQTVHLSCSDTNTISKCTKMRFHKSHVTLEFQRVRPKWFPSLWYVRCKLCTYLASRLALSPNGPKWASTWASSPRSTIGCIQTNFWAYGTFSANRAPILLRH